MGETYQREADGAGEAVVLRIASHLRVCEEEGHGEYCTNDHGATTTPEPPALTHEACKNWRRD